MPLLRRRVSPVGEVSSALFDVDGEPPILRGSLRDVKFRGWAATGVLLVLTACTDSNTPTPIPTASPRPTSTVGEAPSVEGLSLSAALHTLQRNGYTWRVAATGRPPGSHDAGKVVVQCPPTANRRVSVIYVATHSTVVSMHSASRRDLACRSSWAVG